MEKNESNRKVLVTGATGFLGGAVVRHLSQHGWNVTASGRNVTRANTLPVPFISCDLTDPDATDQLVAGHSHVVHCAALSSPWGKLQNFLLANRIGTNHLLHGCCAAGVKRVIHISSPSVTFAYKSEPSEAEGIWDNPAANHYITSKRAAEIELQDYIRHGLSAMVLRPKAIIGPGDTSLLPRIMRVASRGSFPLFGPDCLLDLTAVSDLCEAIRLALDSSSTQTCHITSGQPVSRLLALQTLFAAVGMKVKWKSIPLPIGLALGSTMEWTSRIFTAGKWEPPLTRYSVGALAYGQTLDISRAKQQLNYQPQTNMLEYLTHCGQLWKEGRYL